MSKNNTEEKTEVPALGPGERLQAARISVGMTLEDVANKMHLSSDILNSLEENNFDDITAPIFVKGYLRAYARLVNIDENDIIEQYTQYYTEGDPPISSIRNTLPEINTDDARVKWTTYLVIIVLITLLFMWWWNRYQQPTEVVSLESDAINASDSLKLPVQNMETVSGTESIPVIAVESSDVSVTAAEETAGELSLTQEPAVETETGTVSENPATESSAAVLEKPSESPVENAMPESRQPADEPVSNPESDLTISVNADTWADVRDATGKKLVYDLLKSGETIHVSGKKPYRAFFGNGYGVSMVFEGKEIDLSANIQSNNTARINLGR